MTQTNSKCLSATGCRTAREASKGFCEGAYQCLCLKGTLVICRIFFGEYLLFESEVIHHSHAHYQPARRCTMVELQYLLFEMCLCLFFVFPRGSTHISTHQVYISCCFRAVFAYQPGTCQEEQGQRDQGGDEGLETHGKFHLV